MTDRKHKMLLGRQAPFREHWSYGYLGEPIGGWPIEWPKPFSAFFERIEDRQRYKQGVKPWRPGRYRTSRWQPYTGQGRFSGMRDLDPRTYYAARYTGVINTPEHYFKVDGIPGEYERWIEEKRRTTSWRLAA